MNNKHIGKEVRILSNMISRYIENMSNFQEAKRTTGANTWIIAYVGKHKDIDVFQRDLEKEFSITRSTASKVIQLMEQKGLLVRESVEYDKRLKKIVLTKKAQELYVGIRNDFEELERKLTNDFSEKEKVEFVNLLERCQKNMKEIM